MKIAVPLTDGKLAMHFGHCNEFAFIEINQDNKQILNSEIIAAPPHQPGLLPRWLGERGASVIIAGGMGQRALSLFAEQGITVVVGAPTDTAENLVTHYLAGTLTGGDNLCDH